MPPATTSSQALGKIIKIGGKYASSVIVDAEDFERLSQWKWTSSMQRYARRTSTNNKCILMHRFIMDAPADKQIDHINGNKLDNRKSNLRICNATDNAHNMSKKPNTMFKYKGVRLDRGRPRFKYCAQIKYNYKPIYLGGYETIEEAALAYNRAALKYFGKFAKLNEVIV